MQALPNAAQGPPRDEDAAKEEQMQRELIATLLDTNARERCMYNLCLMESCSSCYRYRRCAGHGVVSRIALVSPDRSRLIESLLSRMAQSGQLRGRVSEAQLIQLLEQVCVES